MNLDHLSDRQLLEGIYRALHKPKQAVRGSQKPADGFVEWWAEYPRKVEKKAAVSAWNKLNLTQKQTAIRVIPEWAKAWRDWDMKYIKLPATWLNKHCFNDPLEQAVPMQQEDITKLDDGVLLERAQSMGINTVGLSRYELIDRIRTA